MFVRGRQLDGRAAAERRQLRLRRLEGRAGCEHAEDRDGGTRTRRLVQDVRPQRHPQLVRDGEREAFAHHADHRRVLVSELHGAAEHIGVAPEARSPHVVPEHGHRWRTWPLVGCNEDAAQERRALGDAKAGGGDLRDLDGTRVAAGDDQVAGDVPPGTELRHRPQRAAPDDEVVQRARLGIIRRDVPVADLDDALARGQRQRGIDEQRQHLEDDGADADRERHRQPADDGEARILHEHPAAELQVEREPVEPCARDPSSQLIDLLLSWWLRRTSRLEDRPP